MEKELKPNIGRIFLRASNYMENYSANRAWEKSLEEEKIGSNFLQSDIEVIRGLSKMLGSMDIEGQVSNIDLITELINQQIKEAEVEKNKNEKLCKTLGSCVGLAISVVLI